MARIVGGAGDQDEVAGLAGAGDEPFAAGDDVGVAALLGAGRRSSTGSEPPPGCGSVMAKAERTLPSTIGASQRSFCSGRAQRLQHHHVAVVRRRRIEDDRAEDRAVHLLVADGHADLAKPGAAGLGLELEAPQPVRPRLGAKAVEQRQGDVAVRVIGGLVGLQRQDLVARRSRRCGRDIPRRGRVSRNS